MERTNDVAVTIRLPRELYEALKALAEAEERSLAQVVRRAARAYVTETSRDR